MWRRSPMHTLYLFTKACAVTNSSEGRDFVWFQSAHLCLIHVTFRVTKLFVPVELRYQLSCSGCFRVIMWFKTHDMVAMWDFILLWQRDTVIYLLHKPCHANRCMTGSSGSHCRWQLRNLISYSPRRLVLHSHWLLLFRSRQCSPDIYHASKPRIFGQFTLNEPPSICLWSNALPWELIKPVRDLMIRAKVVSRDLGEHSVIEVPRARNKRNLCFKI